jgi:hypothetical protein
MAHRCNGVGYDVKEGVVCKRTAKEAELSDRDTDEPKMVIS